jgi:hypothetical protein
MAISILTAPTDRLIADERVQGSAGSVRKRRGGGRGRGAAVAARRRSGQGGAVGEAAADEREGVGGRRGEAAGRRRVPAAGEGGGGGWLRGGGLGGGAEAAAEEAEGVRGHLVGPVKVVLRGSRSVVGPGGGEVGRGAAGGRRPQVLLGGRGAGASARAAPPRYARRGF